MTGSQSQTDFSRRQHSTNTSFMFGEQLPLQERLLHEADRRRENREKLKREQELQLMQECSFQPRTYKGAINKNKFGQIPIHERVDQMQKEKNERLQQLRVRAEVEQTDN